MGPEEENTEANILGGFDFRILPTGVHWADGNGLEDTQEADGADRHTPACSINIQKKLPCKITENTFQPKSCYCLRNSFREK